MPLPTTYPRSFSHIGITVPDIHQAVKFYTQVMGWYIIMEPSKVKEETESAIGQMCMDVFGEGWEYFEIAHLSTSDGIGIELFSFPRQKSKNQNSTLSNQACFTFVFRILTLRAW
jgi:catechol 2,3-dioxygenase-like lactoylglutathione lyase family enzyme